MRSILPASRNHEPTCRCGCYRGIANSGQSFLHADGGVFAILPRLVPKNPSQPELPAAVFIGMGVFYLLLGLIGLATAVGIFQLKPWARYSTMIFAGILGVICLLTAVGFAVMPLATPPSQARAELPPYFEVVFKAIMVGTQLALVALGAWWLYYFNRTDVKLRFAGQVTGTAILIGRRPLSIAILSIFYLLGSSVMLLLVWIAPSVAFMGILLHGAASRGADSIVQFLVDHGADLNVKTKQGHTPLDVAMGKAVFGQLPVPHDSTVELLRKLGGVESQPTK